jgi:hypothetical protein
MQYLSQKYAQHASYFQAESSAVRNGSSSPRLLKRLLHQLHKRANLINDGNIAYYMNIRIGTPRQNFTVLLDTGSDLLWLPSSRCTPQNCRDPVYYDGSRSSTYQNLNVPDEIQYGAGRVSGDLARDTVEMDDYSMPGQTFLEVTYEDATIQASASTYFSGLIGFALNAYPSGTFFTL